MSPVEIKSESSPRPSGQLKDIQPNKEIDLKIEADLESYYRQSGSKQPKPAEAKLPAAQDQK